jgi:hypothetical protein
MRDGPVLWCWAIQILVMWAWLPMDIYLRRHGYEYMTTEFKEGLKDTVVGPILCFVTAGTAAAFVWHMWSK